MLSNEYLSKLASKCQVAAMCLTYNDSKPDSCPKRLLLEASRALDANAIRVNKKRDGLLMVTARGHVRFMTMRERVAYWLLGNKTEMRP